MGHYRPNFKLGRMSQLGVDYLDKFICTKIFSQICNHNFLVSERTPAQSKINYSTKYQIYEKKTNLNMYEFD